MRLRHPWRAGFEIEVVLGSLGLARFEEYEIDPMDQASQAYCEAVARELSSATGKRWTAPRKKQLKPGYYVLPEYDLDPLDWPRGLVAGVELLTPPLPLDEAEDLRQVIIDALIGMGDWGVHSTRNFISENCGWHINVDGRGLDLSPSKFIVGVDEVAILARSQRLENTCAAPQRHSYGVPLLRHLKVDPSAVLLGGRLDNLLERTAGRGKRYAANFAKLDLGYLELRHFGTFEFFEGPNLSELVAPMLSALELDLTQQSRCEPTFLRRYEVVRKWLDDVRPSLRQEIDPGECSTTTGRLLMERGTVAEVHLNGTADVRLLAARKYHGLAQVRDVQLADTEEAMAIAALDAAELLNAGLLRQRSRSRRFQVLIEQLAAEIRELPPADPGPPVYAGHSDSFWH